MHPPQPEAQDLSHKRAADMATPAPRPVVHARPGGETGMLALLLQYEADIRRAATLDELVYLLANETRRLIPYDQMFVLRQAHIGEGFRVLAASSIAIVDRNAPLIQGIERAIATSAGEGKGDSACQINVADLDEQTREVLAEYPFAHWLWQPLTLPDGSVFGGMLCCFAKRPADSEADRLARIGETAGHSWRALTGGQPVRRIKALQPRAKKAIAILLGLVAIFPVRMSALAPAEVVAARPYVISGPFDGVLAEITVPPFAPVKKGQLLARFDDVRLRNELELATERLAVARARVERATSAAFADTANESRDIAILRAEYQEAEAAYAYARDMLERSRLVAPRDGIAIYTDRREWEGRAIAVGQPIMQVADPREIEVRIDLPAREQMQLKPGSHVKLWLDSQPLWALNGRLKSISYQARPTADGVLAFALTAQLWEGKPQIGSRGTARVHGQWVPFLYSILKRPIASARQALGF